MPRKSKTDRELGWLRNLWEELAAAELRHASFARLILKPTATRGVFHVSLEIDRPDTPDGLPAFRYHTMARYPTGDNTEFLAWAWGRAARFAEEAFLADEAVKGSPWN